MLYICLDCGKKEGKLTNKNYYVIAHCKQCGKKYNLKRKEIIKKC